MCKEKTISLTIPYEKEVLKHTGEMLLAMAGETICTKPAYMKGSDELQAGKSEVDPTQAFNDDTPEEMSDRIDEAVAAEAEVDVDGRPWDERIDSIAKSKKADGRWKLRRNIDKALVDKVLAEYAAPAPPEQSTAAPSPPAPPAPATPPPVEDLKTFADLRNLVTMNLSKIMPTDVAEACEIAGATARMMPALENETPEIVTAVYKELDRIWSTR